MDLYELLGVRKSASATEIRRAFQKRARALHPDLNPGDPVAAERFREVARAFEVLSDPAAPGRLRPGRARPRGRRARAPGRLRGLRLLGAAPRRGGGLPRDLRGPAPRARPSASPARARTSSRPRGSRFEESPEGHAPARPSRALRALRGLRRGGGRGLRAACPARAATARGQVRGSRGHMIFSRRCGDCDGSGRLQRRSCPRCAGEGRLIAQRVARRPDPAGRRRRQPACGCPAAATRGGAAARPATSCSPSRWTPHPLFRREGEDLFCDVPVSMTEAAARRARGGGDARGSA